MGVHTIKAPNGKSYKINAPDGATQEEILSYAKENINLNLPTISVTAPKPSQEEVDKFNAENPEESTGNQSIIQTMFGQGSPTYSLAKGAILDPLVGLNQFLGATGIFGEDVKQASSQAATDFELSNREALTESIMQTRKSKGLDVPEKEVETLSKAGEGKFTKQQVLEKIIQKTIDANPTDEYVQKTFPNFIKEIRANPELANNENVWKTFTQDFPENKKLVVYGDDTVDFFTKGENLPEGMRQTQELADTYGISMEEASRIKQMEPTDQVMEIKKLQVLKSRNQNAEGGLNYLVVF